jgi:hypothetical protein
MKAVDLAAFLSNNGGYAEFLGSHIERWSTQSTRRLDNIRYNEYSGSV